MAKISLSGVQSSGRVRAPAPFELSPQQRGIQDFIRRPAGNLIIEARAGTGKTSTLVEISKDLYGSAAFLAFNKAIATEVGTRLAGAGLSAREVKAATFHAVGLQAWRQHAPASARNVRGEKLSILAEKLGMPRSYWAFTKQAVSLAKQSLVGAVPEAPIDDVETWTVLADHHDLWDLMPEGDYELDQQEWSETALAWSLRLLRSSIAESTSMIDFDDMIYMPLYANLRFWQYDWVLVDEAQDTNRARREISKRLLRPGGRLVAVGDRHQAIYGFTGADSDALDLIQSDFGCELLPLTVTYRCAESIVRLAQQWVPDIEARPDAPTGVVRRMSSEDFAKLIPEPTDAILCRNTKPLVQIAFMYLRKHIACHIEGREIGAQLITLTRKWKSAQTIRELTTRLEDHLDKERAKLLHQHKEDKLHALQDKIETLIVLAETFDPGVHPQALVDLINRLFKDEEGLSRQTITLSTVHKAKGREWDRVYLIGRNTLMPSGYAKQEWQLEQEQNLMYVAVTRARTELIDVDLPERRR